MDFKKYKLVVSDFHIGGGTRLPDGTTNYLENFFFDKKFIEFLDYYSSGDFAGHEMELVLNGDFFEHLQILPGDREADFITERSAIKRQHEIINGHPELFRALSRFNERPNRSIVFLLGNHDPALLWPAVATLLSRTIGGRVEVELESYEFDGVHIEHGSQYQADSAFNKKRYFLTRGLEEPILNLPWGCYFVIHVINKIRKGRPYFGRVYPMRFFWRWAIFNEPLSAFKTIAMVLFYFVSLRFVHSKRRYSSFWRTLKIIKEAAVEPDLDKVAKKILLTSPSLKVLIMGHTHGYRYLHFAKDKLYINTGTWMERVFLDPARLGRSVVLSYAFIAIDEEGHVDASLKEWVGTHQEFRDIPTT